MPYNITIFIGQAINGIGKSLERIFENNNDFEGQKI